MTKVFIGELLPDIRVFPILNKQLGKKPYTGKKAYRAIFDEMDFSFLTITLNPEDADFLLIPYTYTQVKNNDTYINRFIALAKRHKKHIIVFAFGDSEEEVKISHSIILRYAGYRYKEKRENEIIMPTQIFAGDILDESLFSLRGKKEKPVVGFCGWAEFNAIRQRIRYYADVFQSYVKKYLLFNKHALVHLKGVYWRKKGMKALKNSRLVRAAFLVRNFYTANKYTVQGDPDILRKEYIENIQNSDFVLIARGDANMAARFYETLVLGRLPALIDTDWVLPLEDEIDYKKFVVFVPYTDIKNTDKYIRDFWDALTDEEYKKRQKLARDTFFKYLKFDSFLKHVFEHKLKL